MNPVQHGRWIVQSAISVAEVHPAGQILFLDDNEVNVKAAREAGTQAERVQGALSARSVLEA